VGVEAALAVAAGATGLAVWLLVPATRVGAAASTTGARAGPALGAVDPPPSRSSRSAVAAGVLGGVAVWLLVGGWVGVVLAVGAAVGTPLVIGRLEPAAARRRRLALQRVAPLVADLLAAALAAGVPLERAVPVVARAVGGPAELALQRVHHLVELGESPAQAWAGLAHEPGLGPIARSVARSARTGAPLAALLATTAGELRAASAAAALAEVRAVSVRAVLPLGLCLLPAFTLLGIVPVVVGLLRGV
jgi:Flp pilus assembly protein TadB